MKKLAIILFMCVLHISAFAQKIYKLYDISLDATKILGSKQNTWFPLGADDSRSKLIVPPQPFESLFTCLGGIYNYDDPTLQISLFNSSFEEKSPLLDTINIGYYLGSFEKLDNIFDKDTAYAKFHDEFLAPNLSCQQRKNILNQKQYKVYKTALQNTRFNNVNTKNLNISREVENAFKLGVAAEVKASLEKFNLNAKAKAKIDREVTRNISAKDIAYYSIRLDLDYITLAARFIRPHYKNGEVSKELSKMDDNFSSKLIRFLTTSSQSIISYATIIKYDISVIDERAITTGLGASIKADLKPKNGQSATAAGAELEAELTRSVKESLKVNGETKYYMICYARDPLLEIGNGEFNTETNRSPVPNAH